MENKTPLTAQKLLDYLLELENDGLDLNTIHLLYRYDRDSDEELIYEVEEDLFDEQTNNVLETIMFFTDPSEL